MNKFLIVLCLVVMSFAVSCGSKESAKSATPAASEVEAVAAVVPYRVSTSELNDLATAVNTSLGGSSILTNGGGYNKTQEKVVADFNKVVGRLPLNTYIRSVDNYDALAFSPDASAGLVGGTTYQVAVKIASKDPSNYTFENDTVVVEFTAK